ncbi:MAG: NUDIX domain-containing protein [Verrucomicrobiae bacterium]|nr:NUDIX domain-containing protein [Verrucomicrobiae bacterium]MCX7721977.1 NUDIX domain-containing protein [Verrucomicrobiae bacterium]MDW7980268.1 NUDIX domain-containing protein [Verrucomicrobiales bacterium]
MQKISAGLLMYRVKDGRVEVLLVHPGGPFFKHKDEGVWSIPKGEIEPGEDALTTAQREFREETGIRPEPPFIELGQITQKSGKKVFAWACAGDGEPQQTDTNTFRMEWPPRSGRWAAFPEVDRAEWLSLDEARRKIKPAQLPLLERLAAMLNQRTA